MQNAPILDVMRHALRFRVCPQCYQREPKGHWPDASTPRPCEPACPIFVNLPALRSIALQVSDPSIAPYEHAINEFICQDCKSSPSAGDFCEKRATRQCPLSRYAGIVIDVLERVSQAERRT